MKVELEGLLEQEKIITELGIVKILAIFRSDKSAMTVGGRIEEGKAVDGAKVRVKRDKLWIGEGKIGQLQSGQSKVKSAPAGTECGIRYEGKVKIEENDIFEVFSEESKIRKIVFNK